jgi:protein-disulfide isomerase
MFYVIFLLMFCARALAIEPLQEKYLVSYGDPQAPIKIVEYFSFQCPHCLALYRKDFKRVAEAFVDTKKVHWTFHPIPTDLVTVQAMVCLSKLSLHHKKIFLETLLEEAEGPHLTVLIMSKVMELLHHPILDLSDEEFLQNSDAFADAFAFLNQAEKISAVPTIRVNAKLYPDELPDFELIQRVVER